jgi:MOSC domain-containing protein YiiM
MESFRFVAGGPLRYDLPMQESGGRLEAIWIKRARRGRMDAAEAADLVAGDGIQGNADRGGRRQVTILGAEAWGDAEAQLGAEVDPAGRRANLLVRGMDLRECRGRVLAVGDTRIHVLGETRPCPRMDEAHPGLMQALDPEWRAGVFGQVVEGGTIRVGDAVRWAGELPLPQLGRPA